MFLGIAYGIVALIVFVVGVYVYRKEILQLPDSNKGTEVLLVALFWVPVLLLCIIVLVISGIEWIIKKLASLLSSYVDN